LRPNQIFDRAVRRFASAENVKKDGFLACQDFLLDETAIARVQKSMDSQAAALTVRQTDARKI
jgi:hypothetical protein